MAKHGPYQDPDLIAQILVTALLLGDKAATERHGVSERTVQRYRARMRRDATLAELVARKKELAEKDWADELPAAIQAGIRFIRRSATEADPKDPDALHAVAGALKILADVSISKRVIDARLAGQSRTPGAPTQPVAPAVRLVGA